MAVVIPVMGIPVTVSGGFGFSIGIDGNISVGVDRNCDPNVDTVSLNGTGVVKPYGSLKAFVDAGIDLLLIKAGVVAELTLIGVAVPLTSTVRIHPDTSGSLVLDGGAKLDLDLHTMDGRVAVYVRVRLLFKTLSAEQELVKWNGVPLGKNLFDMSFDPIPLAGLQFAINNQAQVKR